MDQFEPIVETNTEEDVKKPAGFMSEDGKTMLFPVERIRDIMRILDRMPNPYLR